MQPLPQVYSLDLRASSKRAIEITSRLSDDITSFSSFQAVWFILLATISIIISMVALLATFYQLYLQRLHNEKSLRPLGQIYFWDRDKTIAVRVVNNGLGPLIIDQLTFSKSGTTYLSIEDCLDLDSTSYRRISVNDSVQRVILPNSHLTIFETIFEDADRDVHIDRVRLELSAISLNVDCLDIYDNKISLERDFQWFARYIQANAAGY